MFIKYSQMAELADFVEWLQGELDKRAWRQADLARKGPVHTGLLSKIMNLERNPGPDTCQAIARALNIPPEEVFRRAGLLPNVPEKTVNTQELTYLFDQLGEADQKNILMMLRGYVSERRGHYLANRQTPASS